MNRTIKVDYLARVEGEGSVYVKLKGRTVEQAKLKIFEPPRFFEAFLRGRKFTEAPDITARICGICPVAYQMSSVYAMENVCGVQVEGQLRALRRLLYCGEWIESHALHIYMLHGPDFLGYEDAIQLAKDHPTEVLRGLQLKKIGNDIVNLLGGREIHPINVKVGGFHRLPTKKELLSLVEPLNRARDMSIETAKWVSQFEFIPFERDYEFVALSHPEEYAMNEGRLISSKGLNIKVGEYDAYFAEMHVEHSHALHSIIKSRASYFVGPLARLNLNFHKLSPLAQEISSQIGFTPGCKNPFKGIIARAIETLYACDEALRIIREYEPPPKPAFDVQPRAGTGYGCTEAPRGILYHRYTIDDSGIIQEAKIIPPTAQNQKTIEEDLREYVAAHWEDPRDKLTWALEQTVRNYDPCISCATHFLNLDITDSLADSCQRSIRNTEN